ncbi:MAG TPA: DUF4389 domain-containing protein [Candidatus Nanoarchaeia archaeon]|nr:DUF4389 domain-containing protein [Candidatus Nanoarchaeia archaeon]
MSERKEAFMRLLIGIISGITMAVWKWLVYVFIILNLFYTLIKGKRSKELSNLSEVWNTQWYIFWRYMIFLSNRRPFPIGHLEKNISKHDLRPAHRFKKK